VNLTLGNLYPVCNCGGHDMLEFIGLVEEHVTSQMYSGPWIKDGQTFNVYAAFKEGDFVTIAEPKICGDIIAFSPIGGGKTLASCSKRLTYRLKK